MIRFCHTVCILNFLQANNGHILAAYVLSTLCVCMCSAHIKSLSVVLLETRKTGARFHAIAMRYDSTTRDNKTVV